MRRPPPNANTQGAGDTPWLLLVLVQKFVTYGLEHWGSDVRGVATTRRFLLELLSFQHRYVPPPFFEFTPQLIQWRPSPFVGRSDLEEKLASPAVQVSRSIAKKRAILIIGTQE